MRRPKLSNHKQNTAEPSTCSSQCGDLNSSVSKEEDIPLSEKWNDDSHDPQDQQIAGYRAKARKAKRFAGQTSGIKAGEAAAKKRRLDELCLSFGKKATSRLVPTNNLVHEDSASVPPKTITKARKYKNESTRRLVATKRRSRVLRRRCSGGLWLLRSCDLLNIGRVPLFMMQRKLLPITACGKLQSEKLRARKRSYRLLDFNWMWFQKGFWNCCKKTVRGRIDKVVSYLKLKLQRHIRAVRRPYDMNNNTSGILYNIPQCTTKSCLRDAAAVRLPSVEAPFGNAASSVSLLKDSPQTLLCPPAQWCCADTFSKKTSDVAVLHNQPDNLCVLLTEKEVCISCQEETTAHGEKDDEQIPLTPQKLQGCASDSSGCQENASIEMVENGDESCPMDLDDSTDSDIFNTKLLDHPYCKSPMQQTPCDGPDLQGLQNGQKISCTVPDEQVASCICDFLNEFVKKYGSLIPVTEKDVFTRLKEVFNQDFSDRIPFISKELAKYRARNSRHIGCGFRICYNKHTLYMEDLVTLDEQQWLNDQVINMYGDLIMDTAPDKIHFFNTFFHKQLVTKGYDGVKRWTKKVDLFKKTLLLIPIHLQVHWALVAVNIQNKTITFYDSQGLNLKFCTENILKYIMTEAKERNHHEFLQGWQTTMKKCIPLQKNDFDCGVFMLQYCKCLAQEQPFLFSQEDMPLIRKWIYKELCEHRLMD